MSELIIQNDCTKFLELENIFYKFSDGSTSLIRPFQLELDKWLVFAARELILESEIEGKGNLVLITKTKEVLSIPVIAYVKYEDDIGKFWCLSFLQQLPTIIAKKVFDYKKIILSTSKRKENRYDVGISGAKFFKLAQPDCIMLVSNIKVKCIFTYVSIHGALLIGQKAVFKKNDTRITIVADFLVPNEKISQKGVIVNSERMPNELIRYSIKFIEPISILWQKRIRDYSILLEENQ